MRSPGVIYRRYRQIKKKIIFDRIAQSSKRKHSNCYYGRLLSYIDDDEPVKLLFGINPEIRKNFNNKKIPLCMYPTNHGQDPVICDCPEQCNAFVNKWNKDLVIKKFEHDFSNYKIRSKLWPELCTLEWVLDKSLTDAEKEPSFIGKFIVLIIQSLENLLKIVSGPRKDLMN